MKGFEAKNLENLFLQFNKLVKDSGEIEKRINEMHKEHGILIFDHLHFLHHLIKEDINHKIPVGYIKEYVLFKLNTLDEYLKEECDMFEGEHILPIMLFSLSRFNEDIQKKDNYTAEHSIRVTESSLDIGEKCNLSKRDLFILEMSASLHDIGKTKIPDEILNKDSGYTHEEMQTMMHHPIYSAEIIKILWPLEESVNEIENIVKSHHEKLDGSGYPYGWTEKEIPQLTKILTIADSLDAMTHNRVYRPALTREQAIEELKKYSGIQFDKELVKIFILSI